jgi:hypothetical protein
VRIKYRLSKDGYQRYYTNSLRIKLSRFLYDEGVRKPKKAINQNSTLNYQHRQKRQAATTTELSQVSNPRVLVESDNDDHSDAEK